MIENKEKKTTSPLCVEYPTEETKELAVALKMIVDTLKKALECIKVLWDAVMHSYPNKRVVHLALHHPKERVRKKNRQRIMKWINQEQKRGDGTE